MTKAIFIFLSLVLFSSSLMSEEVKDKKTSEMTEEELIQQIIQLDKEIEEQKVRTKATKELRKTVDKLAETVGVDKKVR